MVGGALMLIALLVAGCAIASLWIRLGVAEDRSSVMAGRLDDNDDMHRSIQAFMDAVSEQSKAQIDVLLKHAKRIETIETREVR